MVVETTKRETIEGRTAHYHGPLVLRPRQVRQLIAAPDKRTRKGRRDAALLAVLVGAGLRVGEAVRLTVGNVEHGAGGRLRLTFRTSKRRAEHWRTVTLPTWAARLVSGWLDYSEPRLWLFTGWRGEHLSVRGAEKIVRRYLVAIGRGDLRTHSLRHTFGSMVTRETRSLFVAQKLLGHADPRTTSRYYSAFEVSDADAAAEALTEAMTRRSGG